MKAIVRVLVDKISKGIGFRISRVPKQTNRVLTNVFNSNYESNALVSYLKDPFIRGIKYTHSAYQECYTAAEVLHELGYKVDVAQYLDDTSLIDYSKYKVIYGFGIPFEKVFYLPNLEHIVKILYSPGCNLFFSNKVSGLRVASFFKNKGKIISDSSRVLKHFWTFQYILSDYIVALGNEFVVNTFLEINPNLICKSIEAFYFDVYDIDLNTKDFVNSRKHFLWFGSSGLLHKGLDLVIDIFAKRDDIILHICGASKSEIGFWEFYQPIIDRCHNIIEHGFIDINSDQFKNLMNICAFCIFPSVSEGGSPALLNIMANGGLIPITSVECGIDLNDLGFIFSEFDEAAINTKIDNALSMDIGTTKEKAKFVKNVIRTKYTYANYKANLTIHISEAIKSKFFSLGNKL